MLPKFAFSWHRKESPDYLRMMKNPNLRIQDGVKDYILCDQCENLFSDWENKFYKNIFLPLHDKKPNTKEIYYGPWALKFAVSLSWRTLTYLWEKGPPILTDKQKAKLQQALSVWAQFLLGKRENPGVFEQHLMPLDVIEKSSYKKLSPYINRYFLTTVDMDILHSEKTLIVYSKMFRIIIFGFVVVEGRKDWDGMKLHVKDGNVGGVKHYKIPMSIANYLIERADYCMAAHQKMSSGQKKKVFQHMESNIEKLGTSDAFRAMHYDYFHSGDKAFLPDDET